uniref:Uncharacterized protein n=1 Tax=Arundo donax TaxID=35708 RepID=A0A0A9H0E4_ARUDO
MQKENNICASLAFRRTVRRHAGKCRKRATDLRPPTTRYNSSLTIPGRTREADA